MRRVQSGEVPLMSVLFERHYRALFRYCWRMTGNTQTSEDLVQEVFLKILKNRERFDADASFTAWMYSIARNAQSDAWRKRQKETELVLADPVSDTETSVEQQQEAALLRRALMQLPEDKREVLVMSRFLGMSHAEIAAALGCDEGTSRARLHRALNALRDAYLPGAAKRRSS